MPAATLNVIAHVFKAHLEGRNIVSYNSLIAKLDQLTDDEYEYVAQKAIGEVYP
jgi:hypothetical protein